MYYVRYRLETVEKFPNVFLEKPVHFCGYSLYPEWDIIQIYREHGQVALIASWLAQPATRFDPLYSSFNLCLLKNFFFFFWIKVPRQPQFWLQKPLYRIFAMQDFNAWQSYCALKAKQSSTQCVCACLCARACVHVCVHAHKFHVALGHAVWKQLSARGDRVMFVCNGQYVLTYVTIRSHLRDNNYVVILPAVV